MTNSSSRRRGYAMILVLVFIALVNVFFALSCKHLSAALRVQTAKMLARQRDEGNLRALAAGIALLELALPTEDANGFRYVLLIGEDRYVITYALTEAPPGEPQVWTVHARPEVITDPPELRSLSQTIQEAIDSLTPEEPEEG